MYIVRSQGRYGNQFFQEIFCRYAELVLKQKVRYDAARLKWHFPNGYESGVHLKLNTKKASVLDKFFTLGINGVELPPRLTKKDEWIQQYERLKAENKVRILYDDRLFLTAENFREHVPCDNVVIDGYFFDHRYFYAVRELIKDELVFREPLDQRNAELAEEMEGCESVSVHIRQGDYLNIPALNICGHGYYRDAIAYMQSRLKDPVFYVFSEGPVDDYMPEGCRYIYVDHNTGNESHKDVQLMTHVRHMIIANSTFSYMAALLNKNEDKTVVIPRMYSRDKEFTMAPDDWIRI